MNHDHDTYQTTEQELRELLATLMGGRAAETMYYGLSGTTAGASNDLKVATENATAMVTKYGLTQAGLRVIAKTSLGTYDCSPATAEKADQQIEALLRAALSQAAAMLEEKRELVDRLAAALIEKETLEADEVSAILGPKVVKQ
jgi:cell division protease FtsH